MMRGDNPEVKITLVSQHMPEIKDNRAGNYPETWPALTGGPPARCSGDWGAVTGQPEGDPEMTVAGREKWVRGEAPGREMGNPERLSCLLSSRTNTPKDSSHLTPRARFQTTNMAGGREEHTAQKADGRGEERVKHAL